MGVKNILLYGHTGIGKSTLCLGLYNYIDKGRRYKIKRNINNKDSINLLQEWERDVATLKKFPDATKDTFLPIEIGYEERNPTFFKKVRGITLYEVAGEDIVKLNPTHEDNEKQNPKLEEWINDSSGIIILAPSTEVPNVKNDMLSISQSIQNFLALLGSNDYNIPICFVITKWDLREPKSITLNELAEEYYRTIVEEILDNKKSNLLSLSIGKIDYENDTLLEVDITQGIEDVFEWIKSL